MNKYHVSIKDKELEIFQKKEDLFLVDETQTEYMVKKIGPSRYIITNSSFTEECFVVKSQDNEHILLVAGKYIKVIVQTELEKITNEMYVSNLDSSLSLVKAQMPGLLNKIFIESGAMVEQGDALFELEAMKMKNIVKSDVDGKVVSIDQKEGTSLEKGTLIITIQT